MPLIDIDEFETRYVEFERLDSKNDPHTFRSFWIRKVAIEKQEAHLLDDDNIDETLSKLGAVLKIWQWHRPYEFEYCFERFRKTIGKVVESYAKIRKFNLMEFDQVPLDELENIWDAFGSVKPQGEYGQGELAMTITKPLMFLWGQTPAFDSRLRDKMPLFSVKGFRNTRWEFDTWVNVMKKLQSYLNDDVEVVDLFKKTSVDKYRTDTVVPFGQFFDLYYWTKSIKKSCSQEESSPVEEKRPPGSVEEALLKKEFSDFINLLNSLKNSNKITGEGWREYEKQWIECPQLRSALVAKLKHL